MQLCFDREILSRVSSALSGPSGFFQCGTKDFLIKVLRSEQKDELTRISTFTFSVVIYKSSNRTYFSLTKFKF